MDFDPIRAQTRFGYGLSPEVAGPTSIDHMVELLRGPDSAAARFHIPQTQDLHDTAKKMRATQLSYTKAASDTAEREAFRKAFGEARRAATQEITGWIAQELVRRAWSPDALRERLVSFWADHFSAPGKNIFYRYGASSYVETAIRPHISGRFEDLLIAAVTHPQMVSYLDQTVSVGPNSPFAKNHKGPQPVGLNENLAREILELHTLGVDGKYTQTDVRQLAELLTGMTARIGEDLRFLRGRVEPGGETVLGETYGGGRSSISDIHAALRDLARHPDTAAHISRKLVQHFLSDRPEPELVAHLEQTFLETRGDLAEVTEAMLRHPAAWRLSSDGEGNFKQPDLFMSSALRALAVPVESLQNATHGMRYRYFVRPLQYMGQPWRRPLGPDGFEEGDTHWLTAQGLGARLQWAMGAPVALGPLPDPREFVETALGPDAPAAVRFAAEAAENRREGVALVLMSPAFQRV